MANVQIGHAGFDHDHICPFRQIPRDHPQGFVAVCRIYLIGIFVARERTRGPNGITEWPIKSGRKLGRIAQYADVVEGVLLQHGPQSTDAPIHHIRRSKNIGTRLSLCLAHFDQSGHGFVVNDLTVPHDAIVAVDVIRI